MWKSQSRMFSRASIPISLTHQRAGFLLAMANPNATEILQENWMRVAPAMIASSLKLPPVGLSVLLFRISQHVCNVIIFPPPKMAGDPYFGLIVSGPVPGDDWTKKECETVTVRYFLLDRPQCGPPELYEWRGPAPASEAPAGEDLFEKLRWVVKQTDDPRDFIETILTRVFGFDLSAE